jgi:hypothetical protein
MSTIAFHSNGTSTPHGTTSSRRWAAMALRCRKCRKILGNHAGKHEDLPYACPIGPIRDGTYYKFSETDAFEWPPNVTYVDFKALM